MKRFQRYIWIVCLFVLSLDQLVAQAYDKNWVTGWQGYGSYDTTTNAYFSNFNVTIQKDSTPKMQKDSLGISFAWHSVTMSDKLGDSVLFYTNGVTIWNKHNQVMQNGDSLGWGWWYSDSFGGGSRDGVFSFDAGFCFPTKDSNIFNYIYIYIDTIPTDYSGYSATKLLWSRINVAEDRLVFKDSCIASPWAHLFGNISAVKDNTGDGWWIMSPHLLEGCFSQIHVDSNSHITTTEVCPVNLASYYWNKRVTTCFTTDGSKFVYATSGAYDNGNGSWFNKIQVFDFNRCTGDFTLQQSFNSQVMLDSALMPWTMEVSPNSRFLYLFCSSVILQYDLWAADIGASEKIIAHYSTTPQPDVPMEFSIGQLALDGKIYVNSGNGVYVYAVIENPDEEGEACHFVNNIRLPAYGWFPQFPNYRLGKLNCDIEECKVVAKLYPNPASSQINMEYNGVCWEASGGITLEVYDVLGRKMYAKHLPQYSALHTIDVSEWSKGVYIYVIRSAKKELANGKFVKR